MSGNNRKRDVFTSTITGSCGLLLLVGGNLVAQQVSSVNTQEPTAVSGITIGSLSNQERKSVVQKTISLSLKDTTLRHAILAIARESGRQITFDNELPQLSERISAEIKNAKVMDALATVLKGKNLVATIANDGSTIVVRGNRPQGGTNDSKSKGQISGKVIDSASQAAISGATVVIVGTEISTITNLDGSFVLPNVPEGEHLVSIRLIGYKSQEIRGKVEAGKTLSLNVSFPSSARLLSEVVTTATGEQRRVEVATDIVKINADQIRERAPVRDIFDMIAAAQVPGILVARESGDPGAAKRIRIRGIGSISQSNDPVMIIDGVWVDGTTQRPSRIDDLDPASIEKIEIIRGPSAATLFGQDASNGVIVITTKRGQAGPTRWNLSYNRDWGQTYGRQPLFYKGLGTSPRQDGLIGCSNEDVLNYRCQQDTVLVFDPNNNLLSREGVETNNRFALQMDGGSQSVTYSVTLATRNTIGVRRVSDVDRIRHRVVGYNASSEFGKPSALRLNSITTAVVLNPRENLNIGLTFTGSQSDLKNNSLEHTWGGFKGGTWNNDFNIDTAFASWGSGTIGAIERPVKTNGTLIASNIQYRPHSAVLVNANVGAEKTSKNESFYRRETVCPIVGACADNLGMRAETSDDRSVYTLRLNASTSLNLGRFNRFFEIRPSVGGDYKKTDQHFISLTKSDIPVGDRGITGGRLTGSANTLLENALAGWYLNSTIGLFQRVYFDVGIRQDIGSAITSSKDAVYPKIGGSWLISDESFWRPNSFITSLRLRSAIGHSAVQPDLGDIHGKFVNGVEYVDGNFVNSVDLRGVGNTVLRPERAVELEVGFDVDMLNDRLNMIATYAHKKNRNTLVNKTVPPSFGSIDARKENVAQVRNRNVEISATGRAIETRNLLLVLNYALTLSDNKVIALGDGVSPFGIQSSRIQAGYPIAGIWGRRVMGYIDEDDNGIISGNEIIASDSFVYIGWSQPRYRASYGVSLTLNNQFVFDSRLAYQSRYVPNYSLNPGRGAEDINAPLSEQAIAMLNRLPGIASPVGGPVSDLRWNSASITYNLPRKLLQKFGGRSVSVSLQGSNLGLWTNYIGRDPSVNEDLLRGEVGGDNGLTPPAPRLYVLDFRVGF